MNYDCTPKTSFRSPFPVSLLLTVRQVPTRFYLRIHLEQPCVCECVDGRLRAGCGSHQPLSPTTLLPPDVDPGNGTKQPGCTLPIMYPDVPHQESASLH